VTWRDSITQTLRVEARKINAKAVFQTAAEQKALVNEISVRDAAVSRAITARPPWALRRNNCEFGLRSFCVVGSEMMGSDGL